MWRCANCRTVCNDEVCGRCGLSIEESRELGRELGLDINGDEFIEEAVYKPKKKIRDEKRAAKESEKREKRIARLEERLSKAKLKEEQIPSNEKLSKMVKQLKIASIVMAGIIIVFAITGIYQSARIKSLRNQVSEASHANDGITNENKTLSDANEKMSDEIDALNQKVSDLDSQVKTLTEENEEMKPKADFLDQHIKIVEDDSKKTYHSFGCEHLDLASFWAYNSEQVVGKIKYTKCPYCN